MKPKPIQKCYEFTMSDWHELEFKSLTNADDVWSDFIYAETAGKARAAAWRRVSDVFDCEIMDIRVRRKPSLDLYLQEPSPIVAELTHEQLDKMKHAWGFNSKEPGYRNRYAANNDSDWKDLVAKGLANHYPANGEICPYDWYTLTDAGIAVLKSLQAVTLGKITAAEVNSRLSQ